MSSKRNYPNPYHGNSFPPNPKTHPPVRLQPFPTLPPLPSHTATKSNYKTHHTKHHRLYSEECQWTVQDLQTVAANRGYVMTDESKCMACGELVSEHDDGVTTLTTSKDRFEDDYDDDLPYQSFEVGKGSGEGSVRSNKEDGVVRSRNSKSRSKRKNKRKSTSDHSNDQIDDATLQVAAAENTSTYEQRKRYEEIQKSIFSKGQDLPKKRSRLVSTRGGDTFKTNEETTQSSSSPAQITLLDENDVIDEMNLDSSSSSSASNEKDNQMNIDAANEIIGGDQIIAKSSADVAKKIIEPPVKPKKSYNWSVEKPLNNCELLTTDNELSVVYEKRRKYEKAKFIQARGGDMSTWRLDPKDVDTYLNQKLALVRRGEKINELSEELKQQFIKQAELCPKTQEELLVFFGPLREKDPELRCDSCASFVSLHDKEKFICGLSQNEVKEQPSKNVYNDRCSICYAKDVQHKDVEGEKPDGWSMLNQDGERAEVDKYKEKLREYNAQVARQNQEQHHHHHHHSHPHPTHLHSQQLIPSSSNLTQQLQQSIHNSLKSPSLPVSSGLLTPQKNGEERKEKSSTPESRKSNTPRSERQEGDEIDDSNEDGFDASDDSNGSEQSGDSGDDDGGGDSSEPDDSGGDDDRPPSEKKKPPFDSKENPPSPPNNDPPPDRGSDPGDDDENKMTKLRRLCRKFKEEFSKHRRNNKYICERCGFTVSKHKTKPNCLLTQQDFLGVDFDTHICTQCQAPVRIHDERSTTEDVSKVKIQYELYPKYKDGDDSFEFITKFEDALKLNALPSSLWISLLKHVVQNSLLKQWIRDTLELPNVPWVGEKGVKRLFLRKTKPPDYETKLKRQLAMLRNTSVKDLQEFFAQYKDKCYKLDYNMADERTIHECEFKLCNEVKEFLRVFRMSKLSVGKTEQYEFSSVQELQEISELILQFPTKSTFRDKNEESSKFKNKKKKDRKSVV